MALSDHYILSLDCRVIIDQVHTVIMVGLWCYNQPGVIELLIMRILIMVGCVLRQLKLQSSCRAPRALSYAQCTILRRVSVAFDGHLKQAGHAKELLLCDL